MTYVDCTDHYFDGDEDGACGNCGDSIFLHKEFLCEDGTIRSVARPWVDTDLQP